MGNGQIVKSKRAASSVFICADARHLPLADGCIQTVVTSPPYWGLRDYGVEGQLGCEATPEEYVDSMLEVFREVRRVMRPDGTLWLNLGDSYNAYNGGAGPGSQLSRTQSLQRPKLPTGYGLRTKGLKPKDQCLIPHRVALALQADGWWLRDTIVWHKPNPMPSSVTDRTTTAHEYLFLLTKSARYYFDADAIREPITSSGGASFGKKLKVPSGWDTGKGGHGSHHRHGRELTPQYRELQDPSQRNNPLGRNKRSVWSIATQSFHGAHFATYPVKLVEPCILAGTSEKGCCPKCGGGWKRVVERVREADPSAGHNAMRGAGHFRDGTGPANRDGRVFERTIAASSTWIPGCPCHAGDPIPCTVLDPFNGAATTGIAATKHGRSYIGIDRKHEYLEMSRNRLREFMERPAGTQRRRKPIQTGDPVLPFSSAAGGGGRE